MVSTCATARALEKFRKEAQRIRRLRSPHVVRVHDLFDANGTAYYVMDFIDGESLAARMRCTEQPLGEREAMRYFGQVLDALEAIHAAGLCHMDLKPDNLMVDKADNAVLIDFGASKKIAGDQMTSTVTGVSYTNGYAPPEQLESDMDNFGPWTDIYALGATLYKLLTNRKPPMPSAIYSDPTPDKNRSLKFPESVSQQTRWLITRMMTVAWHERPQSVTDVRRMMTRAEQGSTDYQPQENTAIRNPSADYDDPTMVRNKPATRNDGDHTYFREGNQGDGSNSRKWLFALIGLLTLALLGGGLLFFNHNKKKEAAERAQFVSDSLANEKMLAQARSDSIEKERVDSIERVRRDSINEFTVNGVTFAMMKVKGGTFTMGATSEQGSDAVFYKEEPAHRVTLSDYYIGQREVTQALWQAVMGSNPSVNKGLNLPVENVSWDDCQLFINKLNQLTGRRFRLPTEAEWEYAARGGSKSRGYKYSGSNNPGAVAWYYNNSGNKTHPVGQKQANELGIYDMSGNVSEWCQDCYDDEYYGKSSSTNPCNNTSELGRVYRGGSWCGGTGFCRVSNRDNLGPDRTDDCLGLRLAL